MPNATVSLSETAPPERALGRLPEPARDKLLALRTQRDDTRALLEAAMTTVTDLVAPGNELVAAQRELAQLENPDLKLGFADMDKERADQEGAKFGRRIEEARARVAFIKAQHQKARALQEERGKLWQVAHGLCTRIEEWLDKGSSPLALASPVSPEPDKGLTALETLTRLRERRAALGAERRKVEGATMSPSEAKQRLRSIVEGRAAKVHVSGLIHRDDHVSVGASGEHEAFNLLCWLQPDVVVRRLEREVDEQSADRFTLSELDQARELKKLNDKILGLERREEALIEWLAGQGTVVPRRADADPRAVLGVE